jgi:translation initiation factor 4G
MITPHVDTGVDAALVDYSTRADSEDGVSDAMATNRPLPTDATIVSIAPQDDDLDDGTEVNSTQCDMVTPATQPVCVPQSLIESKGSGEAAAGERQIPAMKVVPTDPIIEVPSTQAEPISTTSDISRTSDSFEFVPAKGADNVTSKKTTTEFESSSQGCKLDALTTVSLSKESMVTESVPPAEGELLDSWEDVGAMAPPAPSPVVKSMPGPFESAMRAERRVYPKARLLDLRASCYQTGSPQPADLPSFLIEKSSHGDPRTCRRLGPGGATRGGGAGAGGGGSGGGRYGGSMEDPRRDQSLRHSNEAVRAGRHRKTDHSAASDRWDRGQRVKQKEGVYDQWGPEPVEPLKTSVHRWDRKRKASDELEASLSKVTSILNKMTPENFEKLSAQLCDLEMTSSEMLRRVIGVLFDKAVDEPHFAVVYAALCARLAEATRIWPFIRSVKNEGAGTWSWVADLDVDTSKLIPLDDFSAVTQFLDAPNDAFPEAIGVGQLQLQASDCFLKNDALICCYFAEQRPGVVFAVRHDARNIFGDEKTKLFGNFTTKEEAQQDAMKKASFKRLLLNQCQEEFERNVRSSGGAAALEAAAREAKEKAKQDVLKAARLTEEQGLPPKEAPEELELEVWVMKLKRRMLGNVKFIGELFKQQLLKEKIMHECVKLLLGSLDEPNAVPDDESIEAAAKLFLTIGKQLESPTASKAKLDAYCKRLAVLSRDTKKLTARTRFMLQDLLECRRNGWKERRAKDGPHKLGAKSATTQQQSKNDNQHRRDQERNIARERQRQAVSQQQQQQQQQQQNRLSGTGGSGHSSALCTSQDARQLRYQHPSTVRILARDQELAKIPSTAKEIGEVSPSKEPHSVWSEERVTNRAQSALDEYAELKDTNELVASLDEIPALNRGYKRAFEIIVRRVVEGKNTERQAALEAVCVILDKTRLKPEDITEALLETLEFLPDIAIDSPRAVNHVADLLVLVLKPQILDFNWLTQDSGRKIGDPTSDSVPERAALFRHLASHFSEDSDAVELQQHFDQLLLTL